MELADLLVLSNVVLDLRMADKRQALAEASRRLSESVGISQGVIEGALLAREGLGSTGVGRGLALPHARVPGLRRSCAVLLRLVKPIGFQAIDSKPVDLVCALVAPADSGSEMLTALAALSRALRDPVVADRLRSEGDAQTVRNLIVDLGSGGEP